MDFVTPIKKGSRKAYNYITQPRNARLGRYEELYPERYTSIISTLPEVDISDESLNQSSCVLNRSRNASFEDKGIQSVSSGTQASEISFGTNFSRPRTSNSPPKRRRAPRQGLLERSLKWLGLPELSISALLVPLVVIIAVFALTATKPTDASVDQNEQIREMFEPVKQSQELPTEPTPTETPAIPSQSIEFDITQRLEEEVSKVTSRVQSEAKKRLAEFEQKFSSMTAEMEKMTQSVQNTKNDEIDRMKQSIDELAARLTEKEKSLQQVMNELMQQKNLTSSVAEAITDNSSQLIAEKILEQSQQQTQRINEIEAKLDKEMTRIEERLRQAELDFQRNREESSRRADELIVDEIEGSIEKLRRKLNIISADKTGMADFALESAGAEIAPEWTSRGLSSNAAMIKIWNVPIFYHTVSARVALQPDVNPGNCFAFGGDYGTIGIKLSRSVIVQNVTLEHIPKEISLNGNIDSAPRDFTVYGINGKEKTSLGQFSYSVDGLPIQTFTVKNDAVYRIVQLEFKTNWGAQHTCIYRIRVHGSH